MSHGVEDDSKPATLHKKQAHPSQMQVSFRASSIERNTVNMSTSPIPSQPKKSISYSLSLKISEEDRNRLLTEGAEPLRPLFRKLFEKPEGDDKVDPEAAIPPSLEISRTVRLLDIVRHDWDFQEDFDSEEEEEWEYRHKQWLGRLANALTVVMISHSSMEVPDSSGNNAGTDSEDEAEHWEIEELDAQVLSERLMKEPKRSRSWVKYLPLGMPDRTFTGSDFQEPCDLAAMAQRFAKYVRKCKEGDEKQRKGLKALMKDLANDIEKCESIEAWLVTSLMLFLGAAGVLRLQEKPTRHAAQPVAVFLRNYVATVLLVESVFEGDGKAKTEDEGNDGVV